MLPATIVTEPEEKSSFTYITLEEHEENMKLMGFYDMSIRTMFKAFSSSISEDGTTASVDLLPESIELKRTDCLFHDEKTPVTH